MYLPENELTQRQPFWSGCWWRFSRYEIRNGAIKPAKNGSLEQYDPWDLYRLSQSYNGTPPPYQSLLALLVSLGAFFDEAEGDWRLDKRLKDGSLTPSSQDEILGWCSRFGLIGILPQTALTIETPRINQSWPRARGKRTIPIKHTRMNGEWVSSFEGPIDRQLPDQIPWASFRPMKPISEMPILNLRDVPYISDLLDRGNDIRCPLPLSPQLESSPVATILPIFFPDFEDEGDDFQCPLPLSPQFWRIYSERVDDFLDCAMAFLAAVEPVSTRRDTADLTKLRWFLEPTGISLSFDSERNVQEQWTSSVITSKPAICDHLKTGQRSRAQDM